MGVKCYLFPLQHLLYSGRQQLKTAIIPFGEFLQLQPNTEEHTGSPTNPQKYSAALLFLSQLVFDNLIPFQSHST